VSDLDRRQALKLLGALGAAGAAINLAVLRRSRLRPLQRYLTFIAVTISAIFAWSALVPFALR